MCWILLYSIDSQLIMRYKIIYFAAVHIEAVTPDLDRRPVQQTVEAVSTLQVGHGPSHLVELSVDARERRVVAVVASRLSARRCRRPSPRRDGRPVAAAADVDVVQRLTGGRIATDGRRHLVAGGAVRAVEVVLAVRRPRAGVGAGPRRVLPLAAATPHRFRGDRRFRGRLRGGARLVALVPTSLPAAIVDLKMEQYSECSLSAHKMWHANRFLSIICTRPLHVKIMKNY